MKELCVAESEMSLDWFREKTQINEARGEQCEKNRLQKPSIKSGPLSVKCSSDEKSSGADGNNRNGAFLRV